MYIFIYSGCASPAAACVLTIDQLTMARSDLLPWTETTLEKATKRELVQFFKANASAEFLTRHKLNGQQRAIAKRAKLPVLCAAYRDVLRDPPATLTRSKLMIAGALFETCCNTGTVAHILMRSSDYDASRAKIELLHAKICCGETDFTEAARQHSICASARHGGLLGCFKRGRFESMLGDVTFSGRPSKVHVFGPIRTKCGFQLIQISQY